MKTEVITLTVDNRRKLAHFLAIEYMSYLSLSRWKMSDAEYSTIEADIKSVVDALGSTNTNKIRALNISVAITSYKRISDTLQDVIRYLVSEKWKPDPHWLTVESKKVQIMKGYPDLTHTPRDPDVTIMECDLVQIQNLLKKDW
jgi:hypothetical protein